ncbi:MAG: right-handed parallel beta-helix repeat-containing protein [Candidatus Rokubacteria bacterium]|nr:right-handed parallel beta-helix repeat-containing protein [Candidatus Rokubacteria bacterium]
MMRRILIAALLLVAAVTWLSHAEAATTCTFSIAGSTMTLAGDCQTDATILVPEGMTLDGGGHTITAVDPPAGHFTGAVVRNGGTVAHVTNLTVTAAGLANVCDAGDARLRGIMFQGAGGSITHSEVVGINQGPSGCQEGNAIEVRNIGDAPGTVTVEIAHNVVDGYQKTGIVANGAVVAAIHHNNVGASATQANLAANSVQIGFGATGTVEHNSIAGNQWCGPSNFVATAVLVFDANGTSVSKNNIGGNADVGIYAFADNLVIDNNRVFDHGADCNQFGYDIGVGDWGAGNTVTNNKVRGYATPYDGVANTGKGKGANKTIPQPQD